ncbi:MAG: hypothetical protein ABH840_00180 [Nanoarchaeota archaeon]
MSTYLNVSIVLSTSRKVAYSESFQSWNTLKLKKELFSEFPQLKEKRSKLSYKLIYHRDPKELEKTIKEMIKGGREIRQMLMFLYKD